MINLTSSPLSTDIDTLEYISSTGNELAKSAHSDLMKSQRAIKEGLVQVQRTVSRDGKSFLQNFWIKPDQIKKTDRIIRGHQNIDKYRNLMKYQIHYPSPSNPKDMQSGQEAWDYFGSETEDKSYGEWVNQISGSEKKTVEQYTMLTYDDINSYLRGRLDPDLGYTEADKTMFKNQAEILERAINKFELKDDIVVQRAMYGTDIAIFKRSIYRDNGFTSTAAAPGEFHDDFSAMNAETVEEDTDGKDSLILVRITVPKGKGVGAWVAPVSELPAENEFILNRGTYFRVENVSYKGDKVYVVHMTAIGRTAAPISEVIKKSKDTRPSSKFIWRAGDLEVIADDPFHQ